jgi:hypothetical protein
MRRGFYSLTTASLIVLALLTFTAGTLILSHRGSALSSELDAKRVGDRMNDTLAALNATLEDAVLDRAWQACGCNGTGAAGLNSTFLRANLSAYLNSTRANLSDALVTVAVLDYSLSDYAPGTCNATFSVNASWTVRLNGTGARATVFQNQSRLVTTFNQSEFNVSLARAGGGYLVRVLCA